MPIIHRFKHEHWWRNPPSWEVPEHQLHPTPIHSCLQSYPFTIVQGANVSLWLAFLGHLTNTIPYPVHVTQSVDDRLTTQWFTVLPYCVRNVANRNVGPSCGSRKYKIFIPMPTHKNLSRQSWPPSSESFAWMTTNPSFTSADWHKFPWMLHVALIAQCRRLPCSPYKHRTCCRSGSANCPVRDRFSFWRGLASGYSRFGHGKVLHFSFSWVLGRLWIFILPLSAQIPSSMESDSSSIYLLYFP
jgi:hypothetical protein